MTGTANRHWAAINEVSFVAGMRLLFLVFRVFGRWPFRLMLYPVLLWYVLTQGAPRRASRAYLARVRAVQAVRATQAERQSGGAGDSAAMDQINVPPPERRSPNLPPGTGKTPDQTQGEFHGQTVKQNGNPGSAVSLLDVLRHFAAFAEAILDKMLLWGGLYPLERVRFHGIEAMNRHIAEKRGTLLICSHLGNLELCRVLSRQRSDLKLTVLVHTKHAQAFNQMLGKLDPASQLNLLQVTEMTPATAMLLSERIAQGEFVVIAGDRVPVSPNPRVATANFLGQPAAFPIGPYVLASILQCPLYMLFCQNNDGQPEVFFEPLRDSVRLPRRNNSRSSRSTARLPADGQTGCGVANAPTGSAAMQMPDRPDTTGPAHGGNSASPTQEEVLQQLVAEYAARLEAHCLRAPLQWFNFYDFWQLAQLESADAAR